MSSSPSEISCKMKRVGYWMSEKKNRKLNLEEQKDIFRNAGIELIKLDLEKPLEEQGPFDMILHKFTNIMVKAEMGKPAAVQQMDNIKKFLAINPDCLLVDRFECLKKLIDRNEQYKLLLQCDLLYAESCVFTPTFVELTTTDIETNKRKLLEANVKFPFVCKPTVAHGTSMSHQMCLIFNEAGLKDVEPPCVAQTFINHNAILYKVFVIGEKQYITERPSLKNFQPEDAKLDTIPFDSNDISKPNCDHILTKLDEVDQGITPIKPDMELLTELGEIIRQELGLELFGIDVIIDCETKKYAIIDINAFPGYEGVDDFVEILANHLTKLLADHAEKKHSTSNGSRGDANGLPLIGISNGVVQRKRLKKPQDHQTCSDCKVIKLSSDQILLGNDSCNNNGS